eukprot:3933553-Rhodomonas_salina.1
MERDAWRQTQTPTPTQTQIIPGQIDTRTDHAHTGREKGRKGEREKGRDRVRVRGGRGRQRGREGERDQGEGLKDDSLWQGGRGARREGGKGGEKGW